MKKISILSLHLGYGGIEKAVVNLANSLANDYNVEIACSYKLFDEPGFKLKPNIKVKYLMGSMKPNRDEIRDALKSLNVIKLIKELSYAIKVLHFRKKTMVDYLKQSNSDIIISTRDIFNEWLGKYGKCSKKIGWEHNHHHGNKKYANKIIKSVKKLDYLVLVSKDLCNYYSNRVNGCKCVYIPNTIDEIPTNKSKLNNKKLISVGRLSPEKGYMDLLKVFNKLHSIDSKYTLDIIGDGILMDDMKEYIKNNNLSKCVYLHGFKSKEFIEEKLLDSSIYLMCSYTESFGIVLIEAMSFGVPCIAFDSAEGACEVIENCQNGFLISDRNIDAMIDKIIYLTDNKSIREKMGNLAAKSVEKYTGEVVSKQWFSIIEKSDDNG